MTDWKSRGAAVIDYVRELAVLLVIVFIIRTFGFGLYVVPTGSMETTMLVGERFFADKFTILFSKPVRGDIISLNDPTYPYSTNRVKRLFEDYVWGPSNWTKRVIGVPGERVRGVIEDGKPVIYINDKKLDEPYLNKYPIIGVFKQDPSTWKSSADQGYTLKSFDPNLPLDSAKQPFYRINPYRVVYNANGLPEIKYPGTPTHSCAGFSDQEDQLSGASVAPQKQGNHWDGSDEFYIELGPNEYWCMGDNRLGSCDCRFFGPIKVELIHGKIIWRLWSIDSDDSWWILDLIKHPIDFWTRVRWSRFFQTLH
jgi:signal peptidase I